MIFNLLFDTNVGQYEGQITSDGTSIGKSYVGTYSPERRKDRIQRFIEKRNRRVWTKKVSVGGLGVIAYVRLGFCVRKAMFLVEVVQVNVEHFHCLFHR